MSRKELIKKSDEVYIAADDIVQICRDEINFIRDCAMRNARGRARICAHKGSQAVLHEMLIGISGTSYVRPHRHDGKSESFHLIEGRADIVILDEAGNVTDVIGLSEDDTIFYRLESPSFHTLLVNSPVLVIHETTNGPFDPQQTIWAPFAPEEGCAETAEYMDGLRKRANAFLATR